MNKSQNHFLPIEYELDQLVWAKIKGYPWWPAKVIEKQLNSKTKPYIVKFLNDEHDGFMTENNLREIHDKRCLNELKRKGATDKKKIEVALAEAHKILQEKGLFQDIGEEKNDEVKIKKEKVTAKIKGKFITNKRKRDKSADANDDEVTVVDPKPSEKKTIWRLKMKKENIKNKIQTKGQIIDLNNESDEDKEIDNFKRSPSKPSICTNVSLVNKSLNSSKKEKNSNSGKKQTTLNEDHDLFQQISSFNKLITLEVNKIIDPLNSINSLTDCLNKTFTITKNELININDPQKSKLAIQLLEKCQSVLKISSMEYKFKELIDSTANWLGYSTNNKSQESYLDLNKKILSLITSIKKEERAEKSEKADFNNRVKNSEGGISSKPYQKLYDFFKSILSDFFNIDVDELKEIKTCDLFYEHVVNGNFLSESIRSLNNIKSAKNIGASKRIKIREDMEEIFTTTVHILFNF